MTDNAMRDLAQVIGNAMADHHGEGGHKPVHVNNLHMDVAKAALASSQPSEREKKLVEALRNVTSKVWESLRYKGYGDGPLSDEATRMYVRNAQALLSEYDQQKGGKDA